MTKKIYCTLFVTIFLMSMAMPAIAGSEPVEEKTQQHSEQMATEQVMEHTDNEMKEMAQIHSEVKGTDQEKQEKQENPHE